MTVFFLHNRSPHMILNKITSKEEFIGKKTSVQYIITATEYLTRWAEAQLVKDYTVATATKFLFEYVLT